jgi:hypothetical protein
MLGGRGSQASRQNRRMVEASLQYRQVRCLLSFSFRLPFILLLLHLRDVSTLKYFIYFSISDMYPLEIRSFESYANLSGLVVRDDLSPGRHQLHCELLSESADPKKGTEFRMISVMR